MIEFHAPDIAKRGSDQHRDRSASVQRTHADEEGSDRPGECGGLDSGFQDADGVAEVSLDARMRVQAFLDKLRIAGPGPYLFPQRQQSIRALDDA